MNPGSSSSYVYKVLRGFELADLTGSGTWTGSADDRRDGFIHLSDAAQIRGTLARHFADEAGLWLAIVPASLDGLRFEPSRGGALFPHLYRALAAADIAAVVPVPDAARDEWCDNLSRFTPRPRAP